MGDLERGVEWGGEGAAHVQDTDGAGGGLRVADAGLGRSEAEGRRAAPQHRCGRPHLDRVACKTVHTAHQLTVCITSW